MTASGALAPSLGPFFGIGKGRGMALAITASGAACVLVAAAAASFGPLRRLDDAERKAAHVPAAADHAAAGS
jgi:hypothetical protein